MHTARMTHSFRLSLQVCPFVIRKASFLFSFIIIITFHPSHPEPGWSQEAEEAIRSLDKQLQTEPRFQRALKDVALPKGATAQLTCLVSG